MKGVNEFPGYHKPDQVFGFVDHFISPVVPKTVAIADNTGAITVTSSGLFGDFSPDSGATVTISDAAGGVCALVTGNTDNNEAYLGTNAEILLFAADKPFAVKAKMKFTESNTDDANVAFGVIDAPLAANVLVDNGAGPKTTASGALFEKRDGEVNWRAWSSLSTTQDSVQLTAANCQSLGLEAVAHAAGSTAYQVLEIEWEPYSSTNGWLIYKIDGLAVYRKDYTFTSATEMAVFVGTKAGGTTGGETVNVDYIALQAKV
jgi:hypothetical protein